MLGTCAAPGWAAARSSWLSQEGVATTNLRVAFAVLAERLRENLMRSGRYFCKIRQCGRRVDPVRDARLLRGSGPRGGRPGYGPAPVEAGGARDRGRRRRLGRSAVHLRGQRRLVPCVRPGSSQRQRLARFTDRIVVLPTTFEMFDLPRYRAVFRRDDFESRSVAPRAEFCHDMAFYLALIDPDRVLPDRRPPDLGVGYMFRTDNERRACGYASLAGNLDLSASGDHRSDPRTFLRVIDRYAKIVTDRLHVAIGARCSASRWCWSRARTSRSRRSTARASRKFP